MQDFVVEMLCCPACHGELSWQIDENAGDRIIKASATCTVCGAEYPVRDEVGLFLTPDLPREDLWAQAGSHLDRFFDEHPELKARLMDGPPDALNGTDLHLRAMLLRASEAYDASRKVAEAAYVRTYNDDYRTAADRQFSAVLERAARHRQPVVDLASGRGALVEKLLEAGLGPIIATDFSPLILRQNRDYFKYFGLYDHLSLITCDARRLPFKANAIPLMSSYLGLANIENPGDVLTELRRVVGGELMAITIFYEPDDATHVELIASLGMEDLLFEERLVATMQANGWDVELVERTTTHTEPTPVSDIIPDMRVDGFPVEPTIIVWATLIGKPQ